MAPTRVPRLKTREVSRLLVVGPGSRGRGGVAAVISMHRQTHAWKRHGTIHLETYDDRGTYHKIASAVRAWILGPGRILRSDIVHVHLAAQTSLLRKLPLVLLARLFRRAIVIHVHAATEESLFARTPHFALRFVFHSAWRVVALSESWAGLIAKHLPSVPITVIPNPVLPHEVRMLPSGEGPVVLLVGKLEPRKGYRDLLAAAAIILREVPDARFWFAGHGELEQARGASRKLGIEHAVRLLGWIDKAELEAVYGVTAILALPSYGEGVPMSVLEAMSFGIPVVCTPVGGLPEWIEHERNGLLVPPGNPSVLAGQILRLLRDPDHASNLGLAGRKTVQDRCSLEIVSTRLERLYTDLLNPSTRTA